MSVAKCLRATGIRKPFQHGFKFLPLTEQRRHEWPYSAKEGVPREFINILTRDYDLSKKGIMAYMEKSRWNAVKEDHKFIPERHRILGPDLATAHFLVKRGAKAKFVGRNTWFTRDDSGNVFLPNIMVPGMHLEAVDATGIQMSYVAFDNMVQLEYIRYMNFSRCPNFSDWCLARMYPFQNSLEFLDISGCWDVTANGLANLQVLKKLKGLKLSNLPNVENMGLMVLLLEEALPECTIFGVEQEKLLPPDTTIEQLTERMQAITSDQQHIKSQTAALL